MISATSTTTRGAGTTDPNLLNNKLLVVVAGLKQKGRTRDQIVTEFTGNGATREAAELLADHGIALYKAARRKSGYNMMMAGIGITIVGILVTAIGYDAARNGAFGGAYIVTLGALVFGPIGIIRGLWRLSVG